jgi:hypothetical protein
MEISMKNSNAAKKIQAVRPGRVVLKRFSLS